MSHLIARVTGEFLAPRPDPVFDHFPAVVLCLADVRPDVRDVLEYLGSRRVSVEIALQDEVHKHRVEVAIALTILWTSEGCPQGEGKPLRFILDRDGPDPHPDEAVVQVVIPIVIFQIDFLVIPNALQH